MTVRAHVYAMVNRENGLPDLVWLQKLPDTDDPPTSRGWRLLAAALLERWQSNPRALPFIAAAEEIPGFVQRTFRVAEVHEGAVLLDGHTRVLP